MSTELRVFRQSGLPARVVDYEAYQAEFTAMADKIQERAGLNMEKAQRMFSFVERQLIKKHNKELRIPIPQTFEEISARITEFGTPLTLAMTKDGNEIVVLLMDEL